MTAVLASTPAPIEGDHDGLKWREKVRTLLADSRRFYVGTVPDIPEGYDGHTSPRLVVTTWWGEVMSTLYPAHAFRHAKLVAEGEERPAVVSLEDNRRTVVAVVFPTGHVWPAVPFMSIRCPLCPPVVGCTCGTRPWR